MLHCSIKITWFYFQIVTPDNTWYSPLFPSRLVTHLQRFSASGTQIVSALWLQQFFLDAHNAEIHNTALILLSSETMI